MSLKCPYFIDFSRYNVFCPYAYKENGTVKSHDLASNYDCHDPRAEWYHTLKVKPYPNLTMVADKVEYRHVVYLDQILI